MADHSAAPGAGGKGILLALGIAIMLAVLYAVGTLPRLQQNKKIVARAHEVETDVVKVAVIKPEPPYDATLVLPGSTQAIEEAQIGARTTGYLRKRYVDIGAHVHAGQVLAEIESPDVDQQLFQANAQVAQSLATVAQASADVANRQATVMQYRSTVTQAQAAQEQARAMVADAQAKLAQLQAAEKTTEAQRAQAQATVHTKEAALKQAMTQRNLAKVTYDRYAELGRQGFTAAQDVDQSRATYENAEAGVTSAQADLDAAQRAVEAATSIVSSAQASVSSGEAEVRAAEKNVNAAAAAVGAAQSTVHAGQANVESGRSVVRANHYAQAANEANAKRMVVLTSFEKVVAPFDGVITARNVDVGALINTGTGSATLTSGITNSAGGGGLFGIARTDVLRILVSVPQAYAPFMHPGLNVNITLNEFPGRLFPGTVSNVSGGLDSVSRTLLAEVHLPNPKGQLLPGMYAQVTFDLPKTSDALRVPATAVIFDAKGTRVAVVTPQNQVHYVDVHVGRDFNTEVEITDGIKASDAVVMAPSDDLIEGQKVTPVLTKMPSPPSPTAPAPPAGHGAAAPPNGAAGAGTSPH